MTTRSFLVSAVLSCFSTVCGGQEVSTTTPLKAVTNNALASSFNLVNVNSSSKERVSLPSLRGKVVLVNFWASWCEPCLEEMPSMEQLAQKISVEKFAVVAINYQEGEQRIKNVSQKLRLSFPLLRDSDGSVARQWQARMLPMSFVIDKQGRTRFQYVGALDWSDQAVQKTLYELLNE